MSIGDSFVAALQVDNNETFHGLLNQYHLKSNKGKKCLLFLQLLEHQD